jgi:hypothetical protein
MRFREEARGLPIPMNYRIIIPPFIPRRLRARRTNKGTHKTVISEIFISANQNAITYLYLFSWVLPLTTKE